MSASLAPECNVFKERYDTCFLKWYSEKYLRGNSTTDECSALFKDYKNCLSGALRERGIDKMLEDAREDNKENDAMNMRHKCRIFRRHKNRQFGFKLLGPELGYMGRIVLDLQDGIT